MEIFVNSINTSKEHHNLLLQNNNQPNEVIEICEESEEVNNNNGDINVSIKCNDDLNDEDESVDTKESSESWVVEKYIVEEENIETDQIFLQDAMTGHYLDTYKKMKYMLYQVTLNSLPKHGRVKNI